MKHKIRIDGHSKGATAATVGALAAIALTFAGCTAVSSDQKENGPAPTKVQQGGSLVIGQEQEIQCADWIGSCAGSIWGTYAMQVQTIPSVFRYEPEGETWTPVATDLMASEPESKVVKGKQQITYQINPEAVWSDGEPITSQDFEYTALEIRDGKDILDRVGYSEIESIETPDAKTAVVTLKSTYVNWTDLFSGFTGVLPAHILEGKDRTKVMADGYSWSGGPWKIESWKKGSSVTLVPNENYWGEKPKLDEVVFRQVTNTSAQFKAFESGQLDVIYPTPQLEAMEEIEKGIPGARSMVDDKTDNVEALWMNHETFPFNNVAVRKSVAYAIDRGAIVEHMYGAIGVDEPAQTFWPGRHLEFGGDAFAEYEQDLEKSASIMEEDGWQKNGDGIWEKDGKPASFKIVTIANDTRRALLAQILQDQLKAAGFEVKIGYTTDIASTLFDTPYQLAVLALVSTDPPDSFASDASLNFTNTDNPDLDAELQRVATTLDPAERKKASLAADQILAENAASLPLDRTPAILLTQEAVGGPLSINPVEGPFWNLNEWGLVEGG